MLKKLKSLFIVEEEKVENKTKNETEKELKKEVKAPTSEQEEQKIKFDQVKDESIKFDLDNDSKFSEKLLMAIEQKNQSGFDYIEFKKAIKGLDKMQMDEATKFKSAFATASTIGVTLPKLVNSVKFYINVIDNENNNFLSSFDKNYKFKIAGREKEIEECAHAIEEKENQIKLLSEEIAKKKKELDELRFKLDDSKSNMEKTQHGFKNAYYNLRSQFEADIQKMEKYLK